MKISFFFFICAIAVSGCANVDDVEKWYLTADEDVKKMMLLAQCVFPRTESLNKDKPIEVFENEGDSFPLKEIKDVVSNSISLLAIDCRKELLHILDILFLIKDDILFSQADFVQFYKSGHDIFRIHNSKPQSGRSIYIEINSLRLEVLNLLRMEEYSQIKEWAGNLASYFQLLLSLTPVLMVLSCCFGGMTLVYRFLDSKISKKKNE